MILMKRNDENKNNNDINETELIEDEDENNEK